jgi:hypothetical protein
MFVPAPNAQLQRPPRFPKLMPWQAIKGVHSSSTFSGEQARHLAA